jgi:hypothetical protein
MCEVGLHQGNLDGPSSCIPNRERALHGERAGAEARSREWLRLANGQPAARFGPNPSTTCELHTATPDTTRDAREQGSPWQCGGLPVVAQCS